MTDVMVSVRMPRSLAQALKDKAQSEHFLDLSELIRSLARKKWLQQTNPEIHELKQIKEQIEQEIRKKSLQKVQQEVNKELENIKSKLQRGGLFE